MSARFSISAFISTAALIEPVVQPPRILLLSKLVDVFLVDYLYREEN